MKHGEHVAVGVTAAAIASGLGFLVVSMKAPSTHTVTPTIPGQVQTIHPQRWLCQHGTREIRSYPLGMESRHGFERDHLIPLSIGGAPRSKLNVWYEPINQAHASDKIEFRLYHEACSGQITQHAAQHEILQFKEAHG
jgi:hypothetical protein